MHSLAPLFLFQQKCSYETNISQFAWQYCQGWSIRHLELSCSNSINQIIKKNNQKKKTKHKIITFNQTFYFSFLYNFSSALSNARQVGVPLVGGLRIIVLHLSKYRGLIWRLKQHIQQQSPSYQRVALKWSYLITYFSFLLLPAFSFPPLSPMFPAKTSIILRLFPPIWRQKIILRFLSRRTDSSFQRVVFFEWQIIHLV